MNNRLQILVSIASVLLFAPLIHAQTAGSNFPPSTSHFHVKGAWYDLRPNFGTSGRLGFQFSDATIGNPLASFYFYFDKTSTVQVAMANAIYSTILTALSTGQELTVFVKGADPYSAGCFEISVAQIGPQ